MVYYIVVNIPIFITALIFMVLTLVVCTLGIIFMAIGDDRNTKYGTKLMAARVYLQGISLSLVALAFVV
jgi:5-bromo-4-chloroindolyl phosphate hydrolysis protein